MLYLILQTQAMKKKILYSILFLTCFHFGFSNPNENPLPPTCPTPVSVTVLSVTSTTFSVSWTESGSATSWHVLILPAGVPAPLPDATGYMVSTSNPFLVTGLSPITPYDIYVRAVCGTSDFSDWSGLLQTSTTITPPNCGGPFTDMAGPNANYANNSNSVVTICPTAPGDAVTVTFSSFDTEAGHDALYVYNGPSLAGPMIPSSNGAGTAPASLPGGYWGNTIPGPFTSTTMDGCLTFHFVSDGTQSSPGWIANVTCAPSPLSCLPPTNISVSNVTETTAVVNWMYPSGTIASATELLVLPYGSPPPTAATLGAIFTMATGPAVISGLPDNCYTVYLRANCDFGVGITNDWSQGVNFCMYNCANNAQCPERLTLIAFLDANTNGIKDSGEMVFNNGTFNYQLNSGPITYGSTNSGTFLIFENNPANSYTLNFSVNSSLSSYFSAAATYSNITVPAGSGSNEYYFPVVQLQPYNDLEVQMVPVGNPRPGFSYLNTIIYKNKSAVSTVSGSIAFTKSAAVSIDNISASGAVANPNGFTYNFTNLLPYESRTVYVSMLVPTIPTVNLGDILTNTVTIQPTAGDAVPSDNTATLSQTVVGSYDPNDKTEAHGGRIPVNTFTANDYLTYTIQFENTGTANASFIRVEDDLNGLLNPATVQVLNASHPYNFRRVNNKLIWNFYNINLPPTATSPALSHGYIQFKVKPNAGYGIGTIIPNAAAIYFDYNPPIHTNTYTTEFVAPLSSPGFATGNFALLPNPAHDTVQLILEDASDSIRSIVVYDILGNRVKSATAINSNQTTLTISGLSSGIYMVEVTTESDLKQIKKLVIQ